MALTNQLKNQHLLWRSGFGAKIEEVESIKGMTTEKLLDRIFTNAKTKHDPIDVANNAFDGLAKGIGEIIEMNKKEMTPEQKRELQRKNRDGIKTLNVTWYHSMIESKNQLKEKMSLFWHGHFACRVINVYYQQLLLEEIRKNALGNFGDLLKAVSKSAAMINFLNNQQNRKQKPNENFAREILELFTLGRGNYTENDIKEAARAFTGWGANLQGEFVFRANAHDEGQKVFLGKSGKLDGDDVIDIILEQKQTARFIVAKIWKFFVNEQVADGELIEELTESFYKSNYDITALMKKIFSADWFYNEKNIGQKIKSPIELLVGIERALPMELENNDIVLYLQRVMGQMLFYPPNVAGWPGGKQWIDSSSLMLRMRMPRLIVDSDEFAVKPKDDDDTMGGMADENEKKKLKKIQGGRVIKATIEWDLINKVFEKTVKEQLLTTISDALLQVPKKTFNSSILQTYADKTSRLDFVKSTLINVMSTPEYQMC
jgi:uncharacterized protein (DUF1800 family)